MEQLELEPPECSSPSCDAHTSEPHAGTDKRRDINTLATAAQFSLVCVFLGGTFIKVFVNANGADECAAAADDDGNAADEANNRAKLRVVVIMIFFNFMVLTLFLGLALYQFTTIEVLPSVRLAETRLMPELRLEPGQT